MLRTLKTLSPIEGRLHGGTESNDKVNRDGENWIRKEEPNHRIESVPNLRVSF